MTGIRVEDYDENITITGLADHPGLHEDIYRIAHDPQCRELADAVRAAATGADDEYIAALEAFAANPLVSDAAIELTPHEALTLARAIEQHLSQRAAPHLAAAMAEDAHRSAHHFPVISEIITLRLRTARNTEHRNAAYVRDGLVTNTAPEWNLAELEKAAVGYDLLLAIVEMLNANPGFASFVRIQLQERAEATATEVESS